MKVSPAHLKEQKYLSHIAVTTSVKVSDSLPDAIIGWHLNEEGYIENFRGRKQDATGLYQKITFAAKPAQLHLLPPYTETEEAVLPYHAMTHDA
ncbi:unnamed protein product [Caretta caretta]